MAPPIPLISLSTAGHISSVRKIAGDRSNAKTEGPAIARATLFRMNRRLFVFLGAIWLSSLATMAGSLPGNYDESKVPAYTLPDPLMCRDGSKVEDVAGWQGRRRAEVLRLFESEMYGRAPMIDVKPSFEVISTDLEALGGKAIRKLVKVWLLGDKTGPSMELLIYLPKGVTGPVPAFLGLNFVGNQCVANDPGVPVTTRWVRSTYTQDKSNKADEASRGSQASRWQVETVLMRGYAIATAYYGDIEEDHPEGWRNGVRGEVMRRSGKTQFAQDDWGAVSAWAWGLSRAMDYLVTDAAINASHVIVHGHSRLGKAALWAGAQDERFAIVISNNSGEGGASLMRRDFGETVAIANAWEPHRFCLNFRRYDHAVESLPVDSHLLIALVAPRPVYVASASEDLLADPKGEFLAAHAAGSVYQLFGKVGITSSEMPAPDQPVGDTIGYHLRTGKHDITAYDWSQYLDFADRHLRRKPSERTQP